MDHGVLPAAHARWFENAPEKILRALLKLGATAKT
jgi:hypothetical protein